jgi:hypothetical protein
MMWKSSHLSFSPESHLTFFKIALKIPLYIFKEVLIESEKDKFEYPLLGRDKKKKKNQIFPGQHRVKTQKSCRVVFTFGEMSCFQAGWSR